MTNPNDDTPRPMTVAEAADYLHYSTRTIRRLIASGELKAVKIGGQWRIPREAVRDLVSAGTS